MQKIPTIFERDERVKGRPVMDVVKAGCEWVFAGQGTPTRKVDGTNVKISRAGLFRRQKPKEGDYDEAAYVPCDRGNPGDRWAFEAFDAMHWKADGIYELVGPKVQLNTEGLTVHKLIHVLPWDSTLQLSDLSTEARTFDGLRQYLAKHAIEGIVFHHPDGRLAKIKRRDFGLPWPITA